MEQSILPLLSAADLGSLACTCQQLLALVTGLAASTWRKAASDSLGPQHPALGDKACAQPQAAAGIRGALQAYSRACEGMRTGCFSSSPGKNQSPASHPLLLQFGEAPRMTARVLSCAECIAQHGFKRMGSEHKPEEADTKHLS